ncbi:hypothetical protein BDY21DRAFT_364604 [Lineolata rhizophorae]|uniref:Uncharacterized protein n=1 Tax=Lineolata rhizophorae TaxID=578093 RepID=A0A6A6NXG8_9PEZI|nr:hypothetical protein BDY21DRAFT_364604 [Lineolata rhizophorae]
MGRRGLRARIALSFDRQAPAAAFCMPCAACCPLAAQANQRARSPAAAREQLTRPNKTPPGGNGRPVGLILRRALLCSDATRRYLGRRPRREARAQATAAGRRLALAARASKTPSSPPRPVNTIQRSAPHFALCAARTRGFRSIELRKRQPKPAAADAMILRAHRPSGGCGDRRAGRGAKGGLEEAANHERRRARAPSRPLDTGRPRRSRHPKRPKAEDTPGLPLIIIAQTAGTNDRATGVQANRLSRFTVPSTDGTSISGTRFLHAMVSHNGQRGTERDRISAARSLQDPQRSRERKCAATNKGSPPPFPRSPQWAEMQLFDTYFLHGPAKPPSTGNGRRFWRLEQKSMVGTNPDRVRCGRR